jgi:hypothetical protein
MPFFHNETPRTNAIYTKSANSEGKEKLKKKWPDHQKQGNGSKTKKMKIQKDKEIF